MKNEIFKWNVSDISSQKGRTILITGTVGIGHETALVLAKAGANVIIAGRNAAKGEEAIRKIRAAVPSAQVSFEIVDLADLSSIRLFGERMRRNYEHIDVLINNAALMTPPKRLETADHFEIQFGTNYLGPFALTKELLPLIHKGRDARVITVASLANRNATINFEDLQSINSYKPMAAYGQSKLANLMFSFELQRRFDQAGWNVKSIAVHPGIAKTTLTTSNAGPDSIKTRITGLLISLLAQPPAQGAWPSLFAATSSEARGGAYYGPQGFGELRGLPGFAKVPQPATDLLVAKRLWEVSEKLTNEVYPL